MVDKRRFFQSDASTPPSVSVSEPSLFVVEDDLEEDVEIIEAGPTRVAMMSDSGLHESNTLQLNENDHSEVAESVEVDENHEQTLSQIGYEMFKSQLSSILGENVSEKAMKHLFALYFNRPNYIHLAANHYFNGLNLSPPSETFVEHDLMQKSEELKEVMERLHSEKQAQQQFKKEQKWARFIGSLDVEAWATRPYLKPLRYRQPLEIRRLVPNKMKKSTVISAKFGDSAIIRIYTEGENGREFGRIPEDITRILAPLIDLQVAEFEVSVIMDTKGRLSIGDPFFVEIRCYLTNLTFAATQVINVEDGPDAKKRKLSKNEAQDNTRETEAEAALRLKQKSLSRLFDKLGIIPHSDDTPEVIEIDENSQSSATLKTDIDPSDELSLDQIKQFYLNYQQLEFLENLPNTTSPPSENTSIQLRPYQKHGLSWMLSREKEVDVMDRLSSGEGEHFSTQKRCALQSGDNELLNPLWGKFRWPKDPTKDEEEEAGFFYANLYNGELSLEKPVVQNFVKGGILADEMGLGKTISTLSLIHSVPYDTSNETTRNRNYASKTTLVVVPMSLLSQWKAEFDRSNSNSNHRCYIYYGELVQADLSQLMCNRATNIPIVALTTFGTVQNEWSRLNKLRDEDGFLPKVGLFSVEFFRVVLDEGHNIRNRNTKTAKSVHELEARRRWILTGTPVINRLDDIFSLVKFLRLEPWSTFSYWKTFVTLPFEQKKFNQTLDVVKSILQPIFLRRTKNMKQSDGTPLVELPEKEVIIEELEFSKLEQIQYDFFRRRAHQSFAEGLRTGELLKKYTQILTHILRLRQICCHPQLVTGKADIDNQWVDELSEQVKHMENEKFSSDTEMKQKLYALYSRIDIENSECSICTQVPIALHELTITECGHRYCLLCLMDHLEFQTKQNLEPLCPDCRHPISRYRLFKVRSTSTPMKEVRFHTNEALDDPLGSYDFQIYHYDPDKSSSKIEALIKHLRLLQVQSPGEQVVVFSQFSSYLDLIENELNTLNNNEEQSFEVYKFDGRLNLAEREKILKRFGADREPSGKIVILLLSLKAGGVGLNLTCANRAFMMDPWWSPGVEDQAIDRIHRIGQSKSVKVVRFIIKDSIENKMLKIQERKRMMGEAVEVEEEERRKQRIEEIKLLFDD